MTRRRARTQRVALVLLTWVAALVVTAGPVAGTIGTGGTGAQDPGPAEPRLELLAQRPVVSPGDDLTLRVQVSDPPADAELSFTMYPALAGRERLDDASRGTRLGRPLRRIDNLPVTVFAQPDGTVAASFPIDDRDQPALGFRLARAGVYPLEVVLSTPDGSALDRFVTFVVRLPRADATGTADATLGVNVVVPVGAPLSTGTDGGQQLDPAQAARLRSLAAVLSRRAGPVTTLSAVPETLDALGADPANANAVNSLRTGAGATSTLAATYVPLALGSWFDARLGRDLGDQFRAGATTLASVLGVETPVSELAVADTTTGAAGLDGLRRLGVRGAVVPPDAVGGTPPESALAQPFDLELDDSSTLRVVASDDRAIARLVADEVPVLAAQQVVAELALRRDEAGSTPQGVVLALPSTVTPTMIDALLGQLTGAADGGATGRPTVVPATLAQVVDVPPATVRGQVVRRRWTASPPAGLGTYPAALAAAHVSVDGFRSMVATTDPDRVVPLDRNLLVSGDRSLTSEQRQAYLDAATATVQDAVRSISVPVAQSVTITARDAVIPVTAVNDADQPVQVRVTLQSEKLAFPDGDSFTAVLNPGSNRLEARVRARASGAFPLEVRVTSPDKAIAVTQGRVQVRSTAVSGLGLALSIGAGVFLLLWWGRHLRRGRRQHRLVGVDEE